MKKSRSFLFGVLLWCLSFCLPVWSSALEPANEPFQAHFENEGLDVNLCWPTRPGALYRVETSENLTDFTPTNISRYGNGGIQRVHVYSFPPPVPPVPDPNPPPPDLRPMDFLYFTVNPFTPAQTAPFGLSGYHTLFTWHQRATPDEPAQVCRVLLPTNFAEIQVGETSDVGRFPTFLFYYNVDPANTHKLHYDFSTWASPFQASYLSYTLANLSPAAAAVIGRLEPHLTAIREQASDVLGNQATAQVPEPVPYVPGQRKFYRVIETRLDTDGDGLFDDEEMGEYNSDPYSYDTDGDGYSDGHEIDSGSDPGNAADTPISGGAGAGGGGSDGALPENGDLDGDGLTNIEEVRLGTNPRSKDTDKDGAWDGVEMHPSEKLLTYAPSLGGSYADIEIGTGILIDVSNRGEVLIAEADGVDPEGKPLFKYSVWSPSEQEPKMELPSKPGNDPEERLSYSHVVNGIVYGTGLRKSAYSAGYYSQAFKKPLNGEVEWLIGDNDPDPAPPELPFVHPHAGGPFNFGTYEALVCGVDLHGSVYAKEWRSGVEGNFPASFSPPAVMIHNSLTVWGTDSGSYGSVQPYLLAPNGDAPKGKEIRHGRLDALSPEGLSVSFQEAVKWVTTVENTTSTQPEYAGGKFISVDTIPPSKLFGFYYRKNSHSTVADGNITNNSVVLKLPTQGNTNNIQMNAITDMAKEESKPQGNGFMNGPIIGGSSQGKASFWVYRSGKWEQSVLKTPDGDGPPVAALDGEISFIEDDGDIWLNGAFGNFSLWNGRGYTPFSTVLERNGVAGASSYEPKKITSKGLIGCQKGTMTKLLLPAEVVSRDKYLAGSFVIPEGWDSLEMEFVGPTENLGKYGGLLGGGTTKIYDRVQDIFNEADMAAGGQSATQKVWFVKESTNPRKINFYTCFNAVGDVQIKLYLNGSTTANGAIAHTLIAASDFASTIAYVDAWVKGTSFQWAESAPPQPPVLGAPLAATQPVGASNAPEEEIDNFTRGCLIPFFTVINQVEGFAAVAHGLFDGVKNGLQDDWKMILFIKEAAVLAGNWAWQQVELEILEWRTDPLKRVGELKQLADRLCEEFIFKPLKELADDLSTWEGFKERAWRVWQAIKGLAQTAWSATKNVWNSVVDGLTDWGDDFCNRMMQGAEKTHWAGAPWAKDKLFNDINTATREMSYTFGYTFGYLGEQVAVGVLTAGAVKIAQVMAKGGLHLALTLAKRSTAAVAARAHMLKRILAETTQVPHEILELFHKRLSAAGGAPTGDGMLKVPLEVLQEGAESARFNFKQYFDSVFDSPKLNKFLRQGDEAAQKAANSLLLDRMAQMKTILGDEFTETLQKNFVKVVEDLILVKRPDGTVDEFFEGFLRAMEGNPSLLKHADDVSVKMGGTVEELSPNAKARLKQILSDPDPGNPWKLDTPEEWNVDDIPIPSNFYARGLLLELQQFKKVYKAKGFQHHPTAAGYDYSGTLSGLDFLVQMKSLRNPDGAFSAMKKAIDKLLGEIPLNAPANKKAQLHIVKRPGAASAQLKAKIDAYVSTLSLERQGRLEETIIEEFIYP